MSKIIKLYHGSNCTVDHPELSRGRLDVDFGMGFYLTSDKTMAEKWACRRHPALINEYTIDLDGLNAYSFGLNEEWLKFVIQNRNLEQTDFVCKDLRQQNTEASSQQTSVKKPASGSSSSNGSSRSSSGNNNSVTPSTPNTPSTPSTPVQGAATCNYGSSTNVTLNAAQKSYIDSLVQSWKNNNGNDTQLADNIGQYLLDNGIDVGRANVQHTRFLSNSWDEAKTAGGVGRTGDVYDYSFVSTEGTWEGTDLVCYLWKAYFN